MERRLLYQAYGADSRDCCRRSCICPMPSKKTFLPRPGSSYIVNVNTLVMPKGGLVVMESTLQPSWQCTEARKMSNLTKVNNLMMGKFMVSPEAVLWPKLVWKLQSTLLWEKRRKRLFGEGEGRSGCLEAGEVVDGEQWSVLEGV